MIGDYFSSDDEDDPANAHHLDGHVVFTAKEELSPSVSVSHLTSHGTSVIHNPIYNTDADEPEEFVACIDANI